MMPKKFKELKPGDTIYQKYDGELRALEILAISEYSSRFCIVYRAGDPRTYNGCATISNIYFDRSVSMTYSTYNDTSVLHIMRENWKAHSFYLTNRKFREQDNGKKL